MSGARAPGGAMRGLLGGICGAERPDEVIVVVQVHSITSPDEVISGSVHVHLARASSGSASNIVAR